VLPCVQNGDQPGKAWREDTKDRRVCVGDEAYDSEEERKTTSQSAVMFRKHIFGAWSTWIGNEIAFGVMGAAYPRLRHLRRWLHTQMRECIPSMWLDVINTIMIRCHNILRDCPRAE